MKLSRISLVTVGAVALITVATGCSTDSGNSSGAPVATTESSVAEPVTSESACPTPNESGIADVQPEDTCVDIGIGNIVLLYSLAIDDMTDARLDVSSGDSANIVPLIAPEEDGGFLMGFVGEKEGEVTVDVYITPTDGSEEVKVQTVETTVTGQMVKGDSTGGGFSFGMPDPAEGSSPSWTDPEAQ